MRRAALVLTVVLVAGCGSLPSWLGGDSGSGIESPAGSANGPSTAYQTRRIIVAFGDSLTAGFGADPGESYPDFLQQELDRRGYDYHVVNEGISGDTSDGGSIRTAIVAARNPEIVIVAFGGNDGLRVLSVDRMRRNLTRMVTGLQREGIKVVLCGMKLPLNYGADYREDFEGVFPRTGRGTQLTVSAFLVGGCCRQAESDAERRHSPHRGRQQGRCLKGHGSLGAPAYRCRIGQDFQGSLTD